MAPTRARAALLVLVVGLLAAGCGDDAGSSGSPPSEAPADAIPWGTDLVSTMVTRDGAAGLVPGTAVRLSFHDDRRASASAGCNTIGVDGATVRDGRLIATAGGMTEMGCDPERHAQDEWLAAFLGSEPTWRWDGSTLVLTGGDAEVTLVDVEVARPDRELEGTRWELDSLVEGTDPDSSVSSAPEGVWFELDDGLISGHDGCNSFTGPATVTDTSFAARELVGTRIACEWPGVAVDAEVLRVLADATWSIDGEALTLMSPDGRGLVFRATDAAPQG